MRLDTFYDLGIRHIQGYSFLGNPFFSWIRCTQKSDFRYINDSSLIAAIHPSHHFFFRQLKSPRKEMMFSQFWILSGNEVELHAKCLCVSDHPKVVVENTGSFKLLWNRNMYIYRIVKRNCLVLFAILTFIFFILPATKSIVILLCDTT